MTDKNKSQEQAEKTNKEAVEKLEAWKEREREVSEKISAILQEEKVALQPFMFFSEFGVGPRVRLVDTSSTIEKNDKQDNSEGNATEDREPDGTAEPKQS